MKGDPGSEGGLACRHVRAQPPAEVPGGRCHWLTAQSPSRAMCPQLAVPSGHGEGAVLGERGPLISAPETETWHVACAGATRGCVAGTDSGSARTAGGSRGSLPA